MAIAALMVYVFNAFPDLTPIKKLAFFAADGELSYEKVVDFMDLCRNNGAQNLGIVFDDLRAE